MAFVGSLAWRLRWQGSKGLRRWTETTRRHEESRRQGHKRAIQCEVRRPRVGVSSAIFQLDANGSIARNGNWTVLLVQRGKPPAEGLWSLPGGSLDFGEKLKDGAAREVEEETGLGRSMVEVVGKPFMAVDRIDDQHGIHFVVVQCIGFAPWDAKPVAADDAKDAKFVRFNELRTIVNENRATEDLETIVKHAYQLILQGHFTIPQRLSAL